MPGRLKVYLADTLESPERAPPGGLDLTHKVLTQEHEAARKVKKGGDILVCLGNPPYNRQQLEDGDTKPRCGKVAGFDSAITYRGGGGERGTAGCALHFFADFTESASKAGAGMHLKNLYSDYVYFWRWAFGAFSNSKIAAAS